MPRLFAYGLALPLVAGLVASDRPVRARLAGWHAAFAAGSRKRWGTRSNPAPILALVPGSSCRGLAVELSPEAFETAVAAWSEQEGADRRVEAVAEVGLPLRRDPETVAFLTVDPGGPDALRSLPHERLARMAVVARGHAGTGVDYLRELQRALREWGLDEPVVTALWKEVEKERGEGWR